MVFSPVFPLYFTHLAPLSSHLYIVHRWLFEPRLILQSALGRKEEVNKLLQSTNAPPRQFVPLPSTLSSLKRSSKCLQMPSNEAFRDLFEAQRACVEDLRGGWRPLPRASAAVPLYRTPSRMRRSLSGT